MLQRIVHTLIVALLVVASNSCYADEVADIYQVEVIFFENYNKGRFDSESWPKYVGKLETNKAINYNNLKSNIPESIETLDTMDAMDEAGQEPVKQIIPKTVYKVPPAKMLLNKEASMIKDGKSHRFIEHIAWIQPMALNVRSTPVYFQLGKNAKEIEGTVSVKPIRNYFNVSLDFIFKTGDLEYRLAKDLKLKRREIFYVDHPMMGAMIMVTPVLIEAGTPSQI